MQAYLFVHFREKSTPDGEQVYFGISRDGFNWEPVNDGNPILWCYYGDRGSRDFTIIQNKQTKRYYIFGTDLSLSYGMRTKYKNSWKEIAESGSKYFSFWESSDLLNWKEQRRIKIGNENFGCLWAPDVIYDDFRGEYILHWSSSHKINSYGPKRIYYSRSKNLVDFTEPQELFRKDDSTSGVIDSAIYKENDYYYMFLKSEASPAKIIMLKSEDVLGPYKRIKEFDTSMESLESGLYEAPTAVQLDDGKWCLFLDFYGTNAEGQGYVPFIADSLSSGIFVRADQKFTFPYGYKHGTIVTISHEDYLKLKAHKWK